MEKPFYGGVLKRLRNLQQLIILGWLVTGIKSAYVYFVIRELTEKSFSLTGLSDLVSPGYLTLGAWLIVLLFASVYKKGVVLQREQDLTI
jgi:hypothetical protein